MVGQKRILKILLLSGGGVQNWRKWAKRNKKGISSKYVGEEEGSSRYLVKIYR